MNDVMNQIWFIQINGIQEGPFSALQLRHDSRVTPDSLVWKKGWKKWVPLRDVPELQQIFDDEESLQTPGSKKTIAGMQGKEELVIDIHRDPPILFWLFVALIILIYLFYRSQQ